MGSKGEKHEVFSFLLACDRVVESHMETAGYWIAALKYYISHNYSFLRRDLFCQQLIISECSLNRQLPMKKLLSIAIEGGRGGQKYQDNEMWRAPLYYDSEFQL